MDSIAGDAAWLGGTEIINANRTISYMQNGIKPETLTVSGDCGCENILELAGCDDVYTTPDKDNAPWYDSAIPESVEFAGFLPTNFEGLGSTYTRSVTESIGDGATLGRSRFGSRTLSWKGLLFGSSCCGVAYGLRWLGKVLQGSKNCGNNCYGDDLELLVCCPTMEAALGLGPDLVCNGDFPNSTGFFGSSGNTSITWDNQLVYTGKGAMRAVNPIGGAINFNTTSGCVMPVTQQKTYKLSLRVIGAPGATPEPLGVAFNWFDSFDSLISTTAFLDIGLDNDDGWSLREATASAPLLATSVRVDFTIGDVATPANEARYIDEVKLNQVNYAPVVDPFRTLKNVSLMEGPIVNEQRKMGSTCGGRCGGSTTMEIEFSLVGAQPWLYSAPIPVVNCVNVQNNAVPIIGGVPSGITEVHMFIGDNTAQSDEFVDLPYVNISTTLYLILDPAETLAKREIVLVTNHAAGSDIVSITRGQQGTTAVAHPFQTPWIMQTDCGVTNCADGLLGEEDTPYENCGPPALPPSAIYVGCAAPDVNKWKAVYVTAPRTMWNSISEVVPVITINTGGYHLMGVRLGFYTSADGNPCGDIINNPPKCDLICDTLYISALPGNSKFYIDGRTNKMSLVCGTNSVFPGEPYTLGPFSWPSFDCYGFCMEFAYDPAYESSGLCVSLSLVPRTTL